MGKQDLQSLSKKMNRLYDGLICKAEESPLTRVELQWFCTPSSSHV